jgi:hypothetical protein
MELRTNLTSMFKIQLKSFLKKIVSKIFVVKLGYFLKGKLIYL